MGVNPSKHKEQEKPGREHAMDRRGPLLQQVLGAGRADALLRSGHLGMQLRRQRLPAAHRGGMGIRLSRRQHRQVLFRRRRDRAAEYAWFKPHSQGKPRPVGQKQPNRWGLLRHARQRLAVVQRLVRRDLLRGEPGGEPARAGRRARCACCAAAPGTARAEKLPVGLPSQGVPRLLRRLLRRRQLRLSAGAEGRWRRQARRGRRRRPGPRRPQPNPLQKPADEVPAPAPVRSRGSDGSTWPAQGHHRLRQRSQRHPENLEHARQRQGRETAHQGRPTPTPIRASRPTASGSSTPPCAAAFPKSG